MQISVQFTKVLKSFDYCRQLYVSLFFKIFYFQESAYHTIKRNVTSHRSCLHLEQKPVGAIVKEVR